MHCRQSFPLTVAALAAGLFSCVSAQGVLAAPVGMVGNLSGSATLERDGQKLPLKPLQRLEPGDTVVCGTGASAVVVLFADGSRYNISPNMRGKVAAGGVAGATKLGAFSGPSAGVVKLLGSSRVGAAMSRKATSLQRLTPNFPGYLESTRPTVEWLPVSGAASYTFTLFDGHDNVVWSVRSSGNTATYPAELPELATRRPYLWRVAAFGPSGKPVPEARSGLLTVLAPADAAELRAAAAALDAPAGGKTADATSLYVLAEVYRSYGVVGRALEVLEDERLRLESGAAEARQSVLAELSPFVQALAAQR